MNDENVSRETLCPFGGQCNPVLCLRHRVLTPVEIEHYYRPVMPAEGVTWIYPVVTCANPFIDDDGKHWAQWVRHAQLPPRFYVDGVQVDRQTYESDPRCRVRLQNVSRETLEG